MSSHKSCCTFCHVHTRECMSFIGYHDLASMNVTLFIVGGAFALYHQDLWYLSFWCSIPIYTLGHWLYSKYRESQHPPVSDYQGAQNLLG